MENFFDIKELFSFKDNYYFGDCFFIIFDNKKYSFIKGRLNSNSNYFLHPSYDIKIKYQNACYFFRDKYTSKIYVGSSSQIYRRIYLHKNLMNKRIHDNINVTELLKITKTENFDLVIIFTDTRDEAYSLEQFIINYFKESGLLLNIANDVRFARLGAKNTKEHIEALRRANIGRIPSEETKQLMSNFHKTNEKAINHFKNILESKRRRLMVDGVEYESLTQAGIQSNHNESSVRKFLRNNSNPNIYWLTDNESPLKGKKLSDDQRKKLTLYRQTPEAKRQFQKCLDASKKKILLNGVMYDSIKSAIKETGISEPSIHRKLKYFNGKENSSYYILNYEVPKPRKVIIDNVTYDSVRLASEKLGLSTSTIKGRIRFGKYKCMK